MSSEQTMKQLAHGLMVEIADGGAIVEDAVSICLYVSRTRGVELTIEEGEEVHKHLDFLHDTAEVHS